MSKETDAVVVIVNQMAQEHEVIELKFGAVTCVLARSSTQLLN